MELHANLINGEWIEGEAVPNANRASAAQVGPPRPRHRGRRRARRRRRYTTVKTACTAA